MIFRPLITTTALLFITFVLLIPKAFASADQLVARYSSWATYEAGVELHHLPADKITHLIYETMLLDPDGTIQHNDPFINLKKEFIYKGNEVNGNLALLHEIKKHHPHLKTLLSIGGWGQSNHFSTVFADPKSGEKFSGLIKQIVQSHGLDGVVLDWRYPVDGGPPESSKHPDDIKHLGEWVEAFKTSPGGADIQIWMTLTGWGLPDQTWNMNQLDRWVDRFELLSIDYYGSWSTHTWHLSPLKTPASDPEKPSTDKGLKYWIEKGVSANKVLLSVGSFSASWGNVASPGLDQPTDLVPVGSFDAEGYITGRIRYDHALELFDSSNYEFRWDPDSESSYLYSSDFHGGHFVSFESPLSLKHRADYVREKNLAGIVVHQAYVDSMTPEGILSQLDGYLLNPYRTFIYIGAYILLALFNGGLLYWLWVNHIQRFLHLRILSLEVIPQLAQLKFVTNGLIHQTLEIKSNSKTESEALDAFHRVGLQWHKTSQTLLDGLEVYTKSDRKLLGDIKLWVEGTTRRINQSDVYFELLPIKNEENWLCSFDPNVLTDMLRHTQMYYDGSPVQISLTNDSAKYIYLDMRVPGDAGRILTSNNQLNVKVLKDGQYRIALNKPKPSLVSQRSDALQNFKKAITGPLDNHSLSQKLIEVLKEDPKVENIWLITSPEEAKDKNNLTYKLESSPDTLVEIQSKGTIDADSDLYFRTLIMQIDLVKQCVGSLLKNKRLLSELQQIIDHKKEILFIRGEKGYSGVYIQGEKEPLIILMRLRHILWYFSSGSLVQIHRSYIVDINKIEGHTLNDKTFEIYIGGQTIPITRKFHSQAKKVLNI